MFTIEAKKQETLAKKAAAEKAKARGTELEVLTANPTTPANPQNKPVESVEKSRDQTQDPKTPDPKTPMSAYGSEYRVFKL